MTTELWISLAGLLFALAALIFGIHALRQGIQRQLQAAPTPDAETDTNAGTATEVAQPEDLAHQLNTPVHAEPSRRPPAVVLNPARIGNIAGFQAAVTRIAAEVELPEPLWFMTTVEDPGAGQAKEALAANPSVVIAVGGDGTVRAVAGAMAGSGVPMAVVPLGTGNLLARNLDLPIGNPRDCVIAALTGQERPMDVGWLSTEPQSPDPDKLAKADDEPPVEHPFVVIGGLGFDAAMVEGAGDDLKKRLGWFAYFVAGVRHLRSPRLRATLELGDAGEHGPVEARTVLVANCGKLPGGFLLFPDARIDDGWLDIGVIDTRSGLFGWADLLRRVILQGIGLRQDSLPFQIGSIEFRRARTITIRADKPEAVQVDGDLLGNARVVRARIQPDAVIIRRPSAPF